MDRLWAPWRLSYVAAAKDPSRPEPCFICRGLAANEDRQNLIVLRPPLSVVLLNLLPSNNRHLLISPRPPPPSLAALTPAAPSAPTPPPPPLPPAPAPPP